MGRVKKRCGGVNEMISAKGFALFPASLLLKVLFYEGCQ